jgi:hypothetical protein
MTMASVGLIRKQGAGQPKRTASLPLTSRRAGRASGTGIRAGDQAPPLSRTFPIQNGVGRAAGFCGSIPLYVGAHALYTLRRSGIEFQKRQHLHSGRAAAIARCTTNMSSAPFYLGIGLFVYYRRTSAAKSRQFFLLCLASFGACCFHYSGYLNTFDEVMYWGNVGMHLLAPAIFVHFLPHVPCPAPSSWNAVAVPSPCCMLPAVAC